MLLRFWSDHPYRATRDLDLLRKGDGSFDAILGDIRTICEVRVEPDAVSFDTDAIRIESIRADDEYAGTRVTLPARSGKAGSCSGSGIGCDFCRRSTSVEFRREARCRGAAESSAGLHSS
jgi:Nucleotidyl transferase AbiEii toxin, Type IV TA system